MKGGRVAQGTGVDIDVNNLPLDAATFGLLGRGTVGVFQLESAGMRDVLRKEDIACRALPAGPMENIPKFVSCKKAKKSPTICTRLEQAIGGNLWRDDLSGAGDANRRRFRARWASDLLRRA